jgi:hypothetical protein
LSPDALIVSRLKALREQTPNDLLTNVRTDKHPAYECGRMAGVVEGLQMALDAAEDALRQEDDT